MQSSKHIGHLVKEGDSGLIVSEDDLCFLREPLPLPVFFLELDDEEEDEDRSFTGLLRFERFSSCLRSRLLLSLLVKSVALVLWSSTRFCFE